MSLPSVEQFKNALSLGGARANYYLVTGTNMGPDFSYLCRAAQLPAATVNPVEVKTPGGRSIKLAGERTFEPWNITVYNDTLMVMRKRFEVWQAQCAQYGSPLGADALGAYGVSNWVVTQLSRGGVPVRSYNFHNMWPQSLGAIDLNFDDAGSIEEFEVTMEYSHYEPIIDQFAPLLDTTLAFVSQGLSNIASVVENLATKVPGAPGSPSTSTPPTPTG